MAVEASLAHSWSGACGSKFRLARVDRRRQRSLRRNFENAPAGLLRTKGRTWDPRPELPPEAGFMRRSCALDDNRSFLTIVRAAS
jgi:hypothetical protein